MDDVEYSRINDSVIEKIVEWLESNGIHKGIEEEIRKGTTDGYYIYSDDMIIQFTKDDGKREQIGIGFFWEDNVELAKSSLEWLRQSFAKNTKFTPFPKFNISDLGLDLRDIEDTNTTKYEDDLKDFIYKVDDSNKLTIQTRYDSVEAFFEDDSDKSYSEHESVCILTIDTKIPIIKIEKTEDKGERGYKFIVDITNENGDSFSIKSIIDSKDKFSQLLQSTIDALHSYPQFSKYADDLTD